MCRSEWRATTVGVALFCSLLFGSNAHAQEAGAFLGASTLLLSGDPADKLDIVFLGDGFQAGEQTRYNEVVDACVAELFSRQPYASLRNAINIHRVNIGSTDSGTDIPDCEEKPFHILPEDKTTALETTFCSGGVWRCLLSENREAVESWAQRAGNFDPDFIMVIVNTPHHGGCALPGSRMAFTGTPVGGSYVHTFIHELNHIVGDLADEYIDGERWPYGDYRGQINEDPVADRFAIKWADLVSAATPMPTRELFGCSSPEIPPREWPLDVVGAFEGGKYACDVYVPQWTCTMRHSSQPLCAVCRRAVISRLAGGLQDELAVVIEDLLIRDNFDDGWDEPGEIVVTYLVESGGVLQSGRWPQEGEMSFEDGQQRTVDHFAGVVAPPFPGESGSILVNVIEKDWFGADALGPPMVATFDGPGTFEIDVENYRLRGRVRESAYRVVVDTLHIKDDLDDWWGGEIALECTISNGEQTASARWPDSGRVGMSSGDVRNVGLLVGSVPEGGELTVSFRITDADDWLEFSDSVEIIGEDTFSFDESESFGAEKIVHIRDRVNYRVTFSIISEASADSSYVVQWE